MEAPTDEHAPGPQRLGRIHSYQFRQSEILRRKSVRTVKRGLGRSPDSFASIVVGTKQKTNGDQCIERPTGRDEAFFGRTAHFLESRSPASILSRRNGLSSFGGRTNALCAVPAASCVEGIQLCLNSASNQGLESVGAKFVAEKLISLSPSHNGLRSRFVRLSKCGSVESPRVGSCD